MTAERDWNEAWLGIEHGYSQDTAACVNGDHQIHRLPDGRWAGDDGSVTCLYEDPFGAGLPGAGPHEPVRQVPRRRSGTL